MAFRDLKLSTKQMLGFGFVLLIMASVNVYFLQQIEGLKNEIDEVTSIWLQRISAISDINLYTSDLRLYQLQHSFAPADSVKQKQAQLMVQLVDKINENVDMYEGLKSYSEQRNLYSEEEQAVYTSFTRKWEMYQDLFIQIFKHSRENETEEAVALLNGEALGVFDAFTVDLEKLVGINETGSFEAARRAEQTYRGTRRIFIILLVVTGLLSAAMASFLVRLITVPVRHLVDAAGSVAKGNLDVQLGIDSKDEIGNLATSFRQMTSSLRESKRRTQKQQTQLQETNSQLQEQKAEVERSNVDLQKAMKILEETQEQLVMQEKMAALGDLVAGIAHEINSPIGVVKSAVDVSKRCLARLSDAGSEESQERMFGILRDNIAITQSASDRIETLVKSLRNFARLDEAEYQEVDIHEGIESSLTLLESELRNRVEIVRDYADSGELACYASQLNQVFITILRNAAAAIDDRGTITITTSGDDKGLVVVVADDGKGIPPEKLQRIFDFGFSAGGTRVKMHSGLSTAYSIIQKHRGDIEMTSKVGKGTTVTIRLPFSGSRPAEPSAGDRVT
jgi:signal transduction histidine kinase